MIRKFGVGVAAFALAAGLVACSQSGAATIGNAGAAAATQPAGGAGRGAGGGPNVFGTVQTINGSTLTIQSQRGNGGTVTVQLDGSTTIRKQVQGALSDAKAGENIVAVGQENNGVLQARQIQLGTGFGAGQGNGQGQGNRRQGTGTPGPRGAGGNATVVRGTVDSVSTDTITVKTNSGTSEQVQLAANGRVIEQSTASASDIKQGDLVIATGQQKGNTLTATTVTLTAGFPNGGNGTAGNGNAPAGNGSASTGSGA